MDALSASLARSPELFPQSWNPATDTVRLIRLSEADYARASFLDDRILTRETVGRMVPWPQLQAAVVAAALEESCSFIFHIGHVGSTLVSRLLGAGPRLLTLREPAILRTLTQIRMNDCELENRLGTLVKLWSRTFQPEQRACIKATSFVSELAGPILQRPSAPCAIFMFVPAETYLATIFGGPNSRKEARVLAESRLQRLHERIEAEHWNLASLSEGELIAMSWVCEMSALTAAAQAAGDRVLWLNFDDFLAGPAASLSSAFRHLGVETTQNEIGAILAGPEMRRYSKAPEHAYDAELRRDVLDQARQKHAAEISRGLYWLGRAAAEYPILKRTVVPRH